LDVVAVNEGLKDEWIVAQRPSKLESALLSFDACLLAVFSFSLPLVVIPRPVLVEGSGADSGIGMNWRPSFVEKQRKFGMVDLKRSC